MDEQLAMAPLFFGTFFLPSFSLSSMLTDEHCTAQSKPCTAITPTKGPTWTSKWAIGSPSSRHRSLDGGSGRIYRRRGMSLGGTPSRATMSSCSRSLIEVEVDGWIRSVLRVALLLACFVLSRSQYSQLWILVHFRSLRQCLGWSLSAPVLPVISPPSSSSF